MQRLFFETLYGEWLLNTAFVGVLVVLITLALAVPAGYALARLTGSWGAKLGIGIFLTYLVPPTLLFIPLSRVVVNLHLDDSLWSLVLVYPSFTVPFSAWLMMGFFKAIPKGRRRSRDDRRLQSAWRVHSESSFRFRFSGILTVAIFSFTLVMQEFVYAVTFISSVRNMTVGVGVPTFLVHGDVYFWGSLMAGCFIASVPIAILYNFLRRPIHRRFHHGRGQVAIDAANHVLTRYKISYTN